MLALDEGSEIGDPVEVGTHRGPRGEGGADVAGEGAEAADALAQDQVAVARGRRLLLGAAVVLGEELEVGRLRCSGTDEVGIGEQLTGAGELAFVPLDRRDEGGELGLGEPGGSCGTR